ncbi:hypothetical protein P171DRAFT_427400 [Karstenula rhodostoma CBS 690.94]|uniref:2EXR domain-containing protein n=1 Tax=Karstenula rhodostoma CBS 690.94 TaxID=1392251 RepID=A0A9P4UG21_9PLEO|nr:hypothetical protein P171DRAFT_427400 [Karstenula rhodostoma CBS 690.94]
MSTFPQFPLLPSELRLRIWELTVEPRTVDVSVSSYHYSKPLPVISTPVPAALQACQEARHELQKHYERAFTEIDNPPHVFEPRQYVWVNFDLDIIDIGPGWHFELYAKDAPKIQRLRFETADREDDLFQRSGIRRLRLYTNVREVFVVCKDGLDSWWRALDDYEWPCGVENVWFVDPDDGKMMRGTALDEMCEKDFRRRTIEQGWDPDTGLLLGCIASDEECRKCGDVHGYPIVYLQ